MLALTFSAVTTSGNGSACAIAETNSDSKIPNVKRHAPSSVRSGIFVARVPASGPAPAFAALRRGEPGRHIPGITIFWPSLFIFMSLLTELKNLSGFVATKISLLRSFKVPIWNLKVLSH
jgi:hypothetical protein